MAHLGFWGSLALGSHEGEELSMGGSGQPRFPCLRPRLIRVAGRVVFGPCHRLLFSEWVCGVLATRLSPCVWGQGSGVRAGGEASLLPAHLLPLVAPTHCDQTCCKHAPVSML